MRAQAYISGSFHRESLLRPVRGEEVVAGGGWSHVAAVSRARSEPPRRVPPFPESVRVQVLEWRSVTAALGPAL